ncbi:hypothetical protein BGW42_000483 [Actinomortierella wolfii]|nr:hypothetical protein BGW42_000483 [Actinomortierella wolfii]
MSRNDDIHIRVIDRRSTLAGIEYQLYPTDDWLRSSIIRKNSPHLIELYSWIRSLGGDPRRGLEGLDGRNRVQSALAPWSRRTAKQLPYSSSTLLSTLSQKGEEGSGNKAVPRPTPANRKRVTIAEDDTLETCGEGSNDISAKDRSAMSTEQCVQDEGIFPSHGDSPVSPQTPQQEPRQEEGRQQTPVSATESINTKVLDFNQNAIQHIATFFKEGLDATGITVFGDLLGPNRRPTVELVSSFFYGVVLSPLLEPALIEAAIQVLQRTLQLHGPEPFAGLWDVSARRRELRDGTMPIISGFFNPSSTAVSNLFLSYPQHSGTNSPTTPSSSTAGYDLNGSSSSTSSSSRPGGSSDSRNDYISIPRRLPAWNDFWELIRAQLRLDHRPETRRFFEFQEFRIHLVLHPDGEQSSSEDEDEDENENEDDDIVDSDDKDEVPMNTKKRKRSRPNAKPTKKQPEREIRDELGRKIVSFLFNVLEQDIIKKNLSKHTFFYQRILMMDIQRTSSARLALDFIFQVVQKATVEPYLKRPVRQRRHSLSYTNTTVATNSYDKGGDDADESSAMDFSFTEEDSIASINELLGDNHNDGDNNDVEDDDYKEEDLEKDPVRLWDSMGKSELTPAGQELLDIAHRMLSWLIQYAQSGMFGRDLDSEWLAREVLQRIGKLQNLRDSEERKGSGVRGGRLAGSSASVSGGSSASLTAVSTAGETGAGSRKLVIEDKVSKCRMRIDQTEAFWRGLIYPHASSFSAITSTHNNTLPIEPSPGLGTFTMIILDLQFRIHSSGASLSKARVPGSLPVFKHVVEHYVAPPSLLEGITLSSVAAVSTALDDNSANEQSPVRQRRTRGGRRGRGGKEGGRASKKAAGQALSTKKMNDKAIEDILLVLENLEWLVMKMEVLIAAWIQSVGLRREDLAGTCLEAHPLLNSSGLFEANEEPANTTATTSTPSTGWAAMSHTLKSIGGTLWTRWQNLEETIVLAVLTEEASLT